MAWMKLTFKTTPEGKRVYFPWSAFGTGYVVQSKEQEQAIRRSHGISTAIGLPLVLATAAAWKLDADLVWRLLGLALVAAHLAHFAWQVKQWGKAMPRSGLELTHKKVREEKLASIGSGRLWFGLGLSGLMVAGSVALILFTDAAGLGVFLVAIFGALGACFWWLLGVQRRVRSTPA
jgi:hypothetical protein